MAGPNSIQLAPLVRPVALPFSAQRFVSQQQTTGALPGTPILTQQYPPEVTPLNLVVEIAWGYGPTTVSSAVWVDITHDVLYQQKVAMTLGRADEATVAQPSQCTFTLDNRSGNYSKGGQSVNYPNVVQGTPIRVRVIGNGYSIIRFQGYAVGFTPEWDTTGRYAVTHVVAAGAKRRVIQKQQAIDSALTHATPSVANLIGYWPCEDGASATVLASGIPGAPAMQVTGTTNFSSFSSLTSTKPIPTFKSDSWLGFFPATTSGAVTTSFVANVPSSGFADQTKIFRLYLNSGSIGAVEFRFSGPPAAGSVRVVAFDGQGVQLAATGDLGFALTNGTWRINVQLTQAGSNITVRVETLAPGAALAGFIDSTWTSLTLGAPRAILFDPDATLTGMACGQIYVTNAYSDIFALASPLAGFDGESIGFRFDRITSEQGEIANRFGTTSQAMGPQTVDTFPNLITAAETLDQGIIFDGVSAGLFFMTRLSKHDQPAAMTLDASIGQIEHPVTPVDDDLLTVNQAIASRQGGSSATFTDATSPMGTAAIGTYGLSQTLVAHTDGQQLQDYASWRVHMGTSLGQNYRYPHVDVKFHHHPELLPTWLNMGSSINGVNIVPKTTGIGQRIDVANLHTVRSQQNPARISLILEGYTETIDQFTWSVSMNTSPYDIWRVGTLALTSGDTSDYVMRLDTDGSSVATGCAAGGTSITVSTPAAHPVWTTVADDFTPPLVLNIGGNNVSVTNITGASSPQTFTLDPTTVVTQVTAGSSVTTAYSSTMGIMET